MQNQMQADNLYLIDGYVGYTEVEWLKPQNTFYRKNNNYIKILRKAIFCGIIYLRGNNFTVYARIQRFYILYLSYRTVNA